MTKHRLEVRALENFDMNKQRIFVALTLIALGMGLMEVFVLLQSNHFLISLIPLAAGLFFFWSGLDGMGLRGLIVNTVFNYIYRRRVKKFGR